MVQEQEGPYNNCNNYCTDFSYKTTLSFSYVGFFKEQLTMRLGNISRASNFTTSTSIHCMNFCSLNQSYTSILLVNHMNLH